MQKLKISDQVVLLTGKDKGKSGKILKIYKKQNRVLVEGINKVKKAVKPTQESPNGGIVDVEKSVHISNVALIDASTGKPTRIKIAMKDGKNQRVSAKSGKAL
ncbi:MAG: 50S ribosomal protein L24 [Bacteriovoracaceae bacterium]|nr:50S ribosomal protein L24 [Bacteriovoracaceae bacterium]